MFKKIWTNIAYLTKLSTHWTCVVFSVLGFIGTVSPLSEIFPNSWKTKTRIMCGIALLIGIWLVSFISCIIYFLNNKYIEIFEGNNGCHVYVQYGDIFSQDETPIHNERRNVVIPVNRCFDTIVDDDLVSSKTLHGIALNKVYNSKIFDSITLNENIQNNLKNVQGLKPEKLSRKEKRKGNLNRYEPGTVAEIGLVNNSMYFLVGLSSFDSNLAAQTSKQEYVIAMQRLLEYCYNRSQQFPIVMPLIGAGLSRTKYSERAILEYIVKFLKMNKDLINSDIHIVVRNNGKDVISITDLQ